MIYWVLSGFILNSTTFISAAASNFMKSINKTGGYADTVSFAPHYITALAGFKCFLSVIHLFLLSPATIK